MSLPLLRPYQEAGVEFLVNHPRSLLLDQMGLGKTPQTILALRESNLENILIICPKYATYTWVDELTTWWPEAVAFPLIGTPQQRARRWEEFQSHQGPKVAIVPPSLKGTQPQKWGAIVIDEAHRFLRNRENKTFALFQRLKSERFHILTGTPISNGPQDLWPLLHLIDPKNFSSYWKFVDSYCTVLTGRFGREIFGPRNVEGLKKAIQPYHLRRLKKDVLQDLPEKTRQAVKVDLPPDLLRQYEALVKDLYIDDGENLLLVSNHLALNTRLRQLTTSPALLGLPLIGPTIDAAVELVESALGGGEKVVIFTPFRDALDIIASQLPQGLPICQVHGQRSEKANAEAIETFRNATKAVLISTTQMGAAWSASTASVGIFVGFDYDPAVNLQCEDRLHRFGQRGAVNIYYIVCRGTVDEDVVSILDRKTDWAQAVEGYRRATK